VTTVIAYSWPSIGEVVEFLRAVDDAYLTDQAHAAASAPAIALFLGQMAQLRQRIGAGRRLILLAHSMGNFALAGALDAYGTPPAASIFDVVLLAAADERADSFSPAPVSRLGLLWPFTKSVGIYFSRVDSVLDVFSAAINGNERLGHSGPQPPLAAAPASLRLVDCREVDITTLNPDDSHQYYYTAPEVIADIASVILDRAAPPDGPVVLHRAAPPPPPDQPPARIVQDDREPLTA